LLETPARLDRRALMIKAARAAAFTALVSSTVLPLAAEATSGCLPTGHPCSSNRQCCSDFCSGIECF
jgi:hypothetical protein